MNDDCILPKLINDKVLGIYQTWFPNLLESFLIVQMRKKEGFYPRIFRKICMWYFYKLEYLQQLVGNDCILPKSINDKVLGIYQTWLLILLESFFTVNWRKTEEINPRIISKFECDTLTNQKIPNHWWIMIVYYLNLSMIRLSLPNNHHKINITTLLYMRIAKTIGW